MFRKLTDLLYWPDIEEITESRSLHPSRILGRHTVNARELLQAYFPDAKKVTVTFSGKAPLEMTCVNEQYGWFACELNRSYKGIYFYTVKYAAGEPVTVYDPYQFELQISDEDIRRFQQGIHYELYRILGAHPMQVQGVRGTQFAVWAPNAKRVSVVGAFNLWDGRRHQMNEHQGIFELFIPGVDVGDLYKFEIKTKSDLTYLKADPVAFSSELRPDNASIVTDISQFTWTDSKWIADRENTQNIESPISVYEVYLGSFARSKDNGYLNYRELADKLIAYVKDTGYTHVELMPVMEHPLDASWGYQVIGYYAPTSRYGTPQDFAAFVDKLHAAGIGVILDWVPAHFPRDAYGLASFDGTCLYEPMDTRRNAHPHWGTLIFDYGRHEVSNYLIANALYWVEQYHVDGIRVDAVASMLYLDYGREDGNWLPNMYGGREHLEAVEFLKHTNSILHKRNPHILTIAEESTAWPMITGDLKQGGLGFDLKWNMGFMNDFIQYIHQDPYFRAGMHDTLTFSMVYAYSEKFMLAYSHDEAVHGKGTMIGKMPGDEESKFAALRATYAYMMTHPGKKLLFMGQDIGEFEEFHEQRAVRLELLEYPKHQGLHALVKDLNRLYKESEALHILDHEPDGFSWINCVSWKDCYVTFVRRGKKPDQAFFVAANFSGVSKELTAGVPWKGKYKEVLNTDAEKYAGNGFTNPRVKTAKAVKWEGQPYSINFKIAAQSVAIFAYIQTAEEEDMQTKKEEQLGTYTKKAVPKKKKKFTRK